MINTMKNTFKYIAFGIALLASSLVLNAQGTYHREGGMATSKKVTGPEGGYYTISLESFATGKTTVTEDATPVDIVLVLDVSGSMSENITSYSYTELAQQNWSYDTFGNHSYYFKDGNTYRRVRRGYDREWDWDNRKWVYDYYLYFDDNTHLGTDQTSSSAVIYSGTLYSRSQATGSKMAALKRAVGLFINAVKTNATQDSQGKPRSIDNQISIVKFAGHGNNNPAYYAGSDQYEASDGGNHRSGGYNYTEVVMGLTSVLNGGDSNLITAVNALQSGGATAANGGMQLALNIISHIESTRESNKVVVLFTDGQPTYQEDFSSTVAGEAIAHAYNLKNTYSTTVYTIGVFGTETTQIKNYMNWTSSNYPNQQGWVNNGSTTTPATGSYYQKSDGANLDDIFSDIASASAAADATAGASTQVRDVISNSFIMPEGDAAQITIYTSDITRNGEGWSDPVEAEGVTYEITTVTTTTGEQHKQLMVTGFDYTKADTYNAGGFTITPGNWVGERYSNATTKYWAGKKLIITFRIKANDEATGGDGSSTNHPDSGIYVQKFNEDGTPVLVDGKPVYEKVNQYDVPHTDLPLLIKIKKDGLRTGESATFQLLRIRPKGWNNDGATLAEKMKNVEYNAIGKPKPGTHDFVDHITKPDGTIKQLDEDDPVDYLLGCGWEDWSKVILTNKKGDQADVEKELYGLDPSWIYMVIEDDWGWAYELNGTASHQTTSDYELNPFEFHNTPRTVNLEGTPIVKHAEAVTINHFKTLEQGSTSREEHYKSSKTNFKSK